MIHDPEMIYYACIARSTTVLAEFNSRDAELGSIAVKCLEKMPLFHSTFTHTVRSRSYSFLMEESFVYFMISDAKLDKCGCFGFLKSLRDAFGEVLEGQRKLEYMSSHCFQGELNPIFRQLFGLGFDRTDVAWSPTGQRMGQGGIVHRGACAPLNGEKGWEKMNKLFGESDIGRRNGEIGLCQQKNRLDWIMPAQEQRIMTGQRNAKKAWKKHVWVVLSFDLIVCTILLGVWLWVCRGFKCIRS